MRAAYIYMLRRGGPGAVFRDERELSVRTVNHEVGQRANISMCFSGVAHTIRS